MTFFQDFSDFPYSLLLLAMVLGSWFIGLSKTFRIRSKLKLALAQGVIHSLLLATTLSVIKSHKIEVLTLLIAIISAMQILLARVLREDKAFSKAIVTRKPAFPDAVSLYHGNIFFKNRLLIVLIAVAFSVLFFYTFISTV